MGGNDCYDFSVKSDFNNLKKGQAFAPFKRNKGKGGLVLNRANIKKLLDSELEHYRFLTSLMYELVNEFGQVRNHLRVKNVLSLTIVKSKLKRRGVESDFGLNVVRYFMRWDYARRGASRPLVEVVELFAEMAQQIPIQGYDTLAEFELNRNELNRQLKQSIDTIANYLDYLELLEFIALKKQTE